MEKAGCVEKEEEAAVVLPGFRFHPTDEELVGFYLRRKVEKKPTRIELIKQTDIYKYDPWDLPRKSDFVVRNTWVATLFLAMLGNPKLHNRESNWLCYREKDQTQFSEDSKGTIQDNTWLKKSTPGSHPGAKVRRVKKIQGTEVSNVGVKDKEWYFYCLRGRKYRNSIRPNRVTGSGFWKATGIDRPIYSDEEKAKDCIGLKKSLVYYRGSAGKGTKTDWMMHEFRLPTAVKNTNASNAKNTDEARTVSYKKFMPTDWIKQQAKQQHPTDSSPKTCSFESDNRERYKCFDAPAEHWFEKKPVTKNIEPNDQIFSGPFSPMAQSTITTLHPTFPSPNTTEFAKEDNWDELGAMMGSLVDPASIFGCGYS
ncbi:hypothetical protein ACLOJK_020016 [Asimina triloba]